MKNGWLRNFQDYKDDKISIVFKYYLSAQVEYKYKKATEMRDGKGNL